MTSTPHRPTGRTLATLLAERPRPEPIRRWPHAPWLAVAAVCLGAFLGQLDASIVTLTYPALRHDFRTTLDAVAWVSLAYLLTLVALLIPAGRLSDALGRKRMYLLGFALFTAGSAGCGLAPGLPTLIGSRVLQATGASLLQANSVALVRTSVPADRLRTGLGAQAAAQAAGLAGGPTVGGLLVSGPGWRWVFLLNIPIGIAAIIAGHYLLPRTRRHPPAGPATPPDPMRRNRTVSTGLAGAGLGYLVLFGPLVLGPIALARLAVPAAATGLLLTALPAGFALAALLGGRLLPRHWNNRARAVLGSAVATAALAVPATATGVWTLTLALLVTGGGLGLFTPANNATVLAAVPARATGTAGGLLNTARALGTALGVAVVTLALHRAGSGPAAIQFTTGLLGIFAVAAGIVTLVSVPTAAGARKHVRGRHRDR